LVDALLLCAAVSASQALGGKYEDQEEEDGQDVDGHQEEEDEEEEDEEEEDDGYADLRR
jgi:ribosomal protein L12E/L44/L45/RPP1/RPP2